LNRGRKRCRRHLYHAQLFRRRKEDEPARRRFCHALELEGEIHCPHDERIGDEVVPFDGRTEEHKRYQAKDDKAYVDNEVSYHEAVIGVLDKTLIPNAKNADLKALLESGKPIFESHLEHAKQLQKTLNK